jgi:hypothetical protein
MYENDLELKLLHGSPIELSNIGFIYPLTLREISDIGEIQYNKLIFSATFKRDDLIIKNHKLTPFETIWVYCYQDNLFREMFYSAIKTFMKEEIRLHENGFFYFGKIEENKIFDEEKYNEFSLIVKKQNFIKDHQEEKEEFNPHDERARELIEKLKYYRQKVKEKNQENGLNLSDIISIVAAHSGNLNIFTVWDLTVYQLYTLYLRLMMKENYESQFYLLPHVSDSKSLDLKHWATKIQK